MTEQNCQQTTLFLLDLFFDQSQTVVTNVTSTEIGSPRSSILTDGTALCIAVDGALESAHE